jgi:hypothetical protein
VVNLFVEAIPHDQRVGQGKPVRFHRMTFLRIAVQVGTCTEHTRTLRENNYPIMVFADTFGKIIGHDWTRMGLWTLSQDDSDTLIIALGPIVLTLILSVRGCAIPSAPLSAKNFAAEKV